MQIIDRGGNHRQELASLLPEDVILDPEGFPKFHLCLMWLVDPNRRSMTDPEGVYSDRFTEPKYFYRYRKDKHNHHLRVIESLPIPEKEEWKEVYSYIADFEHRHFDPNFLERSHIWNFHLVFSRYGRKKGRDGGLKRLTKKETGILIRHVFKIAQKPLQSENPFDPCSDSLKRRFLRAEKDPGSRLDRLRPVMLFCDFLGLVAPIYNPHILLNFKEDNRKRITRNLHRIKEILEFYDRDNPHPPQGLVRESHSPLL